MTPNPKPKRQKPEFSPVNGKLFLYPPLVPEKSPEGFYMTPDQQRAYIFTSEQAWQVAAVDPANGLGISEGDYVYLDIHQEGDILQTKIEGQEYYVLTAYQVLAIANEGVGEAVEAAEGMVIMAPMGQA